jgi:hypothetical protein
MASLVSFDQPKASAPAVEQGIFDINVFIIFEFFQAMDNIKIKVFS